MKIQISILQAVLEESARVWPLAAEVPLRDLIKRSTQIEVGLLRRNIRWLNRVTGKEGPEWAARLRRISIRLAIKEVKMWK